MQICSVFILLYFILHFSPHEEWVYLSDTHDLCCDCFNCDLRRVNNLRRSQNCFPKWPHHFTVPSAVHEGSDFFMFAIASTYY